MRPDGIASYGRPERIAELEAEFRVMLQATNRSPATITAYMAGLTALRSVPRRARDADGR